MTRSFELVVFDWDGTLFDSIAAIVACSRATFEELRLPVPDDERIRAAIGLGLDDSVTFLFPDAPAETVPAALAVYRRLWIADYGYRSRPFPDAPTVLETLVTEGYEVGVATAKSRRGLDRDMSRCDLSRWIRRSRTADETRPKPDPTMLVELIEESGTEPDKTLFVGDSVHDLEMADRAGVTALAVTSGSARSEELAARKPSAVLSGVAEVLEWLAESTSPQSAASPSLRASEG